MKQPSLFDNPTPPPAHDPSMSVPSERPQAIARRESHQRSAELHASVRGFILGGLEHAGPATDTAGGMTAREVAAYVSGKRGVETGVESLTQTLLDLERDGWIVAHKCLRMGDKGRRVTVYVHAMHAKGAV